MTRRRVHNYNSYKARASMTETIKNNLWETATSIGGVCANIATMPPKDIRHVVGWAKACLRQRTKGRK